MDKKGHNEGQYWPLEMVLEKRSGKRYAWIDERLCGLLEISALSAEALYDFCIKEFIKVIMDMWIPPLTTLLEVKIG